MHVLKLVRQGEILVFNPFEQTAFAGIIQSYQQQVKFALFCRACKRMCVSCVRSSV